MSAYSWYSKLKKPEFAPPARVFAPVWSVLYIIIFFTYGFVFLRFINGQLPVWLIVLFVLNLGANLAYTPIQFGTKNNELALADILIVDGTLIASMTGIYGYYPWVTYALIPYLAWVYAATVLQVSVTRLNRKKR